MKIEIRNAHSFCRHIERLAALCPQARGPFDTAIYETLVNLERQAHAIQTRSCNGDERPNDEKTEERILNKVRAMFPALAPDIFINGDPRGYALKIRENKAQEIGIYQDFGGYGILAPEF